MRGGSGGVCVRRGQRGQVESRIDVQIGMSVWVVHHEWWWHIEDGDEGLCTEGW